MKILRTKLSATYRAVFGSRNAQRARRLSLASHARPRAGLEEFFSSCEDKSGFSGIASMTAYERRPVFVFSAGWRSGSTLLQRLISSGEKTLLWGEPYDRCAFVQAFSSSLSAFSSDWPPKDYTIDETLDFDALARGWTANLYPELPYLKAGLRAFMLQTFAAPARARGAERWGLKEVRFGLSEAVLLKHLFPEASFLFIHRDLEEAYVSYCNFSPARAWFSRWPFETAFTPYGFARHWARLRGEFELAAEVTKGFAIKYEDLVTGGVDLDELGKYCGTVIDKDILKVRTGSGIYSGRSEDLSLAERLGLKWGRVSGSRLVYRQYGVSVV
ncbi:MAG: sulfotransferase [Roseibium sp.]|uniref:sulfotransferase n=1 Tax=Roseibium sp. TaxID=1936156 RepID=UPI003D9BFE4E